jgi:phage shock protein A
VTALAVRPYAHPAEREREELAAELRRLREDARSRTLEVDLLVAAMKDHIRDLQAERDYLRAELAQANASRRLESAEWLHRGLKGAHAG